MSDSIGYWQNGEPVVRIRTNAPMRYVELSEVQMQTIRAIVREEVRKALHDVFMVLQTPLETEQKLGE